MKYILRCQRPVKKTTMGRKSSKKPAGHKGKSSEKTTMRRTTTTTIINTSLSNDQSFLKVKVKLNFGSIFRIITFFCDKMTLDCKIRWSPLVNIFCFLPFGFILLLPALCCALFTSSIFSFCFLQCFGLLCSSLLCSLLCSFYFLHLDLYSVFVYFVPLCFCSLLCLEILFPIFLLLSAVSCFTLFLYDLLFAELCLLPPFCFCSLQFFCLLCSSMICSLLCSVFFFQFAFALYSFWVYFAPLCCAY